VCALPQGQPLKKNVLFVSSDRPEKKLPQSIALYTVRAVYPEDEANPTATAKASREWQKDNKNRVMSLRE
jgi:hypothetical protein